MLATGGFSHDASLRERFFPAAAGPRFGHRRRRTPATACVSGWRAARASALRSRRPSLLGAGVTVQARPTAARASFRTPSPTGPSPGRSPSTRRAGASSTRRCRITSSFAPCCATATTAQAVRSTLICDCTFSLDLWARPNQAFHARASGDTSRAANLTRRRRIDALAEAIGVERRRSRATVDDLQCACRDGARSRVRPRLNDYQRHLGDADH